MSKIALLTDSHWGERADSPIFLDYQKLFLDEVFFPALLKYNVSRIIHLGDLVERRKYININTAMRLWSDFLAPIEILQIPMMVLAGNHDIYHKNTSTVNALWLMLDGRFKYIHYITNPLTTVEPEPFLYLPWINDDNREASLEAIKTSHAKIVFGHLELKDFAMRKGQIAQHGMDANIFQNFEAVFTGHYHTKSSRGNIHYLGSPFEFNWGDYGEERGFHIFDTETRELTFIPNPYSLFIKFFYNDEGKSKDDLKAELNDNYFEGVYVKVIVEKKTDPYLFDWLISEIEAKHPQDVVIANAQEVFSRDYIAPIESLDDTPKILKKCVEGIDVSDKVSLENLLIELYTEAQSTA